LSYIELKSSRYVVSLAPFLQAMLLS
jgi:hypothetical protein